MIDRERKKATNKKYREENKEKILEWQRAWQRKNREKSRAFSKKYREENKEKIKKKYTKYRKENPLLIKAQKKKESKKRVNNITDGYIALFLGLKARDLDNFTEIIETKRIAL